MKRFNSIRAIVIALLVITAAAQTTATGSGTPLAAPAVGDAFPTHTAGLAAYVKLDRGLDHAGDRGHWARQIDRLPNVRPGRLHRIDVTSDKTEPYGRFTGSTGVAVAITYTKIAE